MKYLQTIEFFDRACATEKGIPLGSTIILTGPPGVGKTRLAQQAVKALSRNDKKKLIVFDALSGSTKKIREDFDAMKKKAVERQSVALVIANTTKDGDIVGPLDIQHNANIILSLWPDEDGNVYLETHKPHATKPKIALTMTASGLKLAKIKSTK